MHEVREYVFDTNYINLEKYMLLHCLKNCHLSNIEVHSPDNMRSIACSIKSS